MRKRSGATLLKLAFNCASTTDCVHSGFGFVLKRSVLSALSLPKLKATTAPAMTRAAICHHRTLRTGRGSVAATCDCGGPGGGVGGGDNVTWELASFATTVGGAAVNTPVSGTPVR